MNPSRSLMIGAVTGAILLASGCGGGGSSDSAFKKDYAAQRTTLNSIGNEIGTTIQNAGKSTDAQLQQSITAVEHKLRSQLDKLDALKPPSKYKDDFNAVTAASNRVDNDLKQIASAVGAHDSTRAKVAATALVSDGTTLRTAGEKLRVALGLAQTA